MSDSPRVSVILPTYNEREAFELLYPTLAPIVLQLGGEIVIVDDGSPDGTSAYARSLTGPPTCAVVDRPGERGLASAVLAGIDRARGDVLVVMDADGSHPPETLPALVSAVTEGGAEMALGSRWVAGGKAPGLTLGRRAVSSVALSVAPGTCRSRSPRLQDRLGDHREVPSEPVRGDPVHLPAPTRGGEQARPARDRALPAPRDPALCLRADPAPPRFEHPIARTAAQDLDGAGPVGLQPILVVPDPVASFPDQHEPALGEQVLGRFAEDAQHVGATGRVRRVRRDQVERLVLRGLEERTDAHLGVGDPIAFEVLLGESGRAPVHLGQHDPAVAGRLGRGHPHGTPTAAEVEHPVGPADRRVLDEQGGAGVESVRCEDPGVDDERQEFAAVEEPQRPRRGPRAGPFGEVVLALRDGVLVVRHLYELWRRKNESRRGVVGRVPDPRASRRSSFWCEESAWGISTWTVTTRSPREEPRNWGKPRPRIRSWPSGWVPAGILSSACPSIVRIVTSPPRTAVASATVISANASVPSRRMWSEGSKRT